MSCLVSTHYNRAAKLSGSLARRKRGTRFVFCAGVSAELRSVPAIQFSLKETAVAPSVRAKVYLQTTADSSSLQPRFFPSRRRRPQILWPCSRKFQRRVCRQPPSRFRCRQLNSKLGSSKRPHRGWPFAYFSIAALSPMSACVSARAVSLEASSLGCWALAERAADTMKQTRSKRILSGSLALFSIKPSVRTRDGLRLRHLK